MLETEIKKLTQAVTENTEKMAELIQAMTSGSTGVAAPESKPKARKAKPAPEPEVEEEAAKPAPEPEVEEEAAEDEPEAEEQGEAKHSPAELKAKFGELSKAKTGAAVKKLMQKHGYAKFSDITEGDPAIDDMYAEAGSQLED